MLVHMAPIPLAWAALGCWLRGSIPIEAGIAAAAPLLVGLAVAWIGYPAPPTHAIAAPGLRAAVALALAAAVGCGILWAAGRPLPDDRTAAVQWARDSATNNIRPWMAPWRAPWLDR